MDFLSGPTATRSWGSVVLPSATTVEEGWLEAHGAAAEQQGRGDFSPLWAGQNVAGCRAAPAAEVTRALAMGLVPW